MSGEKDHAAGLHCSSWRPLQGKEERLGVRAFVEHYRLSEVGNMVEGSSRCRAWRRGWSRGRTLSKGSTADAGNLRYWVGSRDDALLRSGCSI